MWRSDVLLGETGVPGENHGTASSCNLEKNALPVTFNHDHEFYIIFSRSVEK
jgi:hypothetical protein